VEEAESATRSAEERARVAEERAEAAEAALRRQAEARTEAETTAAMQRQRAEDAEQHARQLHERLEAHQSLPFPSDHNAHRTKQASLWLSPQRRGVEDGKLSHRWR
jgi:hypothetical protein